MGTPTVYAICGTNCKYETLTKEQILSAITQAVNDGTISDIDAGFVTKIKTITGSTLRFFVGTQAEYDVLSDEQKQGTFAIISNDTTKEGLLNAIQELQDDLEDLETRLTNGSITVAKAATIPEPDLNLITNKTITEGGLYYVEVSKTDSETYFFPLGLVYIEGQYIGLPKLTIYVHFGNHIQYYLKYIYKTGDVTIWQIRECDENNDGHGVATDVTSGFQVKIAKISP